MFESPLYSLLHPTVCVLTVWFSLLLPPLCPPATAQPWHITCLMFLRSCEMFLPSSVVSDRSMAEQLSTSEERLAQFAPVSQRLLFSAIQVRQALVPASVMFPLLFSVFFCCPRHARLPTYSHSACRAVLAIPSLIPGFVVYPTLYMSQFIFYLSFTVPLICGAFRLEGVPSSMCSTFLITRDSQQVTHCFISLLR